jgi:hypothetical protein
MPQTRENARKTGASRDEFPAGNGKTARNRGTSRKKEKQTVDRN